MSFVKITIRVCLCLSLPGLLACQERTSQAPATPEHGPSTAGAQQFMQVTEDRFTDLREHYVRTSWVANTHITSDTEKLAALAQEEISLELVDAAHRSAGFSELQLEPELARKFKLLRLALDLPPPNDPALAAELSELNVKLESMYGTGQYCNEERCYRLGEMSEIMANSRDADLLLELWRGWREVSPPMREPYQRLVSLGNRGSRELGFQDLSEQWRSHYDMSAEAFEANLDQQWELLKPLYSALHCHVRARLNDHYGDEVAPAAGGIPAHLLGNMWAQSWDNIHELVAPEATGRSYDLTELIVANYADAEAMVRAGEAFFTSLGFAALPDSFWERSMLVRPRDREVQCHASAWDIVPGEDVRLKMCTRRNAEDFNTVHHELGHTFYQLAYSDQSYFFRYSANPGFHEALGDTIALSITPGYLVEIGLLGKEPPESEDLDYLLLMALKKVAFLPFALTIDKWRWQVFNGELPPDEYNAGWWRLREHYQGVVAPVERSEQHFDPGAKFHVASSSPYERYFTAHIQQFQFQRALCQAIGFEGPLHRCSIYGETEAGDRLQAMMSLGLSQPWQNAMEALTGEREIDASALVQYFAPLQSWLDEQNSGRSCGW